MNNYRQFIHKSRYARYLDAINRRESWEETVGRYIEFIDKHLQKKHHYAIPLSLKEELFTAIKNHDIMPSMRAMMTAGPALERDNIAGYNCAYLPIDDAKSFDEAMYILLCGTGVGFSVESKYTEKLPDVPDNLYPSATNIVVQDSKAGWAKAFRQLVALLYAGEVPTWDISRVRPKGARLKTFGGRASGPEPLVDLFNFTVGIFSSATGRKLTSLECHDIMCKIGEVVVVGGVRRSAMISLSDLNDERMRHAKSGNWWISSPHRALSNNSAVYGKHTSVGEFMGEWLSLYNSKSGERGIFSRSASKRKARENGRRDTLFEFGTNPCSEIILRPYQFCNLSEVVARHGDSRLSLEQKVRLSTILGTFQSTLTDFSYLRNIWRKNTEEERLLGVSLTGIYDCEWLRNATEQELQELRAVAVATNKEFADILSIPQSTAITCVKPSGTVSQLVDSSSGIHPRYSQYYIRRVRQDSKDPLTEFMKSKNIPWEQDKMNSNAVVFSFPTASPDGCITKDDITAIEQLDTWKKFAENWCEHKPSITVYVREHEWMEVGAWVYEHLELISGISFLPYDNGIYQQAPYEEIDKETYEKLLEEMPEDIDWNELVELVDNVTGTQELACVAGVCEI